MDPRTVAATLAVLRPDELWAAWRLIDMDEQSGCIPTEQAQQWKEGIFELMLRWGLEPGELVKSGG